MPADWKPTITRQFTVRNALVGVLLLLVFAFVAVMCSLEAESYIGCRLLGLTEKSETLTFLGIGMGGSLLALQVLMSQKRAKALEDTAKAQADAAKEQATANKHTEQGQRQQRLKNAIEHFGHNSVSVRLGGGYELLHLAEDTGELRETVIDIVCAHIRQITGTEIYQNERKSKPSEEIQNLLFMLFMRPHNIFKGCSIDLRGSWLNGADLSSARLSGANLTGARFQGAYLREARLDGALLRSARLQATDLRDARLRGAVLHWAGLQAADLSRARLQGASLGGSWLQETTLAGTQLQGAKCWTKHLTFSERILEAVGQEGSLFGPEKILSGAKFAGGITLSGGGSTAESPTQNLESIVEGLDGEKAEILRACLQQHLDLLVSRELPEGSGAITGAYTKGDADRWIAEYEGAP